MLTDEDKRWFIGQLDSLSVELAEKLDHVRVESNERLDRVRIQFSERLEKVETTLLTEFHKWASPVDLRQKSHAAALRALDAEVESLSDRLKNLEGR